LLSDEQPLGIEATIFVVLGAALVGFAVWGVLGRDA
jgi:hypothetical protein